MSERRFRRTPGGVCRWGCTWCGARSIGVGFWVGGWPGGCGELLEQIADEHGWQIVAKEVMPDHVHLFVRVGPTDAPAQVVRAFKGRTARVLRCEFPHLRATRRCCGRRRISPPRWVTSGVDGAPLHRAPVGRGDGVVRRAYVFRLRPTARQHVALAGCVEAHRELYNAALQERRDAWAHSKTRIRYGDQSAQLTEIRSVRPDVVVWSFSSQQATLRRLTRRSLGSSAG